MQGPLAIADLLKLQELSLVPVHVSRGTDYPCTNAQLIATQIPAHGNSQQPAHKMMDVLEAVLTWNHLDKVPLPPEQRAIVRFAVAIKAPFGPDLAIKAYRDLDLIFFGGDLIGKAILKWVHKTGRRDGYLGMTEPGGLHRTRITIVLNAAKIWVPEDDPYKTMISTLLQWVPYTYHSEGCVGAYIC